MYIGNHYTEYICCRELSSFSVIENKEYSVAFGNNETFNFYRDGDLTAVISTLKERTGQNVLMTINHAEIRL